MSIEIAANNGLDHSVLIAILSSLDVKNRVVCSNVCEAWKEACDSDRIWEKSHFRLSEPDEAKMCESAAKNYGSMMVEAHFEINQSYIDNRRSLFCIFRSLARIKRKRLRSIKTSFIGVNPLFYKSTSSIESLVEFLGGIGNESWDKIGLINIDLSGFNVALNDTVVDVITQNHPNLRSLDLVDASLVSLVTPKALVAMVKSCRRLRALAVSRRSLSDQVIIELCDGNRNSLRFLEIHFKRDEKYSSPISVWNLLTLCNPDLRVSLIFSSSCQSDRIIENMIGCLPVSNISICTLVPLTNQITYIAVNYAKSLRSIELTMDMPDIIAATPSMNQAIRLLASSCLHLDEVRILFALSPSTINHILDKRPTLANNANTILIETDDYVNDSSLSQK